TDRGPSTFASTIGRAPMYCPVLAALRRLFNRHRTPAPAPEPVAADLATASAPDPQSPFWLTPTPRHVLERQAPLRGEDTALVRPYALNETTLVLPIAVYRRQRAAALAVGRDPSG
ncbi:hypothetical protein ACWF94_27295, partial [Streptomyces sp. NPDC055078]